MLEKLIFANQYAFVPNRGLFDGVMVINDVVDYDMRNKKSIFLFKFSFKKAFDSISWDYLLYVLKIMNFGSRWLRWIKACVFSSSFFVMINGSPTIDF